MKPIAIFSTTNHELYRPFMEPVSRAWENLGFEPMCFNTTENQFVDESEIPLGNQAQIARALLPALYPERMFVITDIDMLPLSYNYFQKIIQLPKHNEIVNVSADAYEEQARLPMCYFVGKGSTFSLATGIKNYEDIPRVMKEWWDMGKGWETDEICFTSCIIESLKRDLIQFGGYGRGWHQGRANYRIDRDLWNYDKELLKKGQYIDSHMLRPYNDNKAYLEPLFESINVKI